MDHLYGIFSVLSIIAGILYFIYYLGELRLERLYSKIKIAKEALILEKKIVEAFEELCHWRHLYRRRETPTRLAKIKYYEQELNILYIKRKLK